MPFSANEESWYAEIVQLYRTKTTVRLFSLNREWCRVGCDHGDAFDSVEKWRNAEQGQNVVGWKIKDMYLL